MKKFNYHGVNKEGRTVTGSTTGASEQEVKAQLVKFGFKNIRVKEEALSPARSGPPEEVAEEGDDRDFVQKLVDGDIEVGEPLSEGEAEEDEWYRAEAFARIRRYRRRENVVLVITLVLLGVFVAYFAYDKMTEIPAPQPEIITRSSSEMLSFKDVYVKGNDLVFVVFSRNWNGNVRVDYQAWDSFGERIDFGTARMGFIGEHYGASPEKTGTVKLKKYKYYERIELLVSGDEDR